jgi:predicted transposase YdaD
MDETARGRTGSSGSGESTSIIDRSVKILIRRVPPAFFRLLGLVIDPDAIRPGDVSVNLPEFRADQLFIVGAEDDPARWALHLEYQLQPDARVMRGWFLKNAALTAQLELPVILTVVYLTRGSHSTFPAAYIVGGEGLTNEYRFHTIRLWEHADRIRGGELPELAPLLVLCEDVPTEQTLQEERRLILGLPVDPSVRTELLAVALTVGTRYFSRDVLERLFREELQMLKEASFIDEWIEQGIAQGIAQGMAQGEVRGRAAGARQMLLRLLRARFGDLPAVIVSRVENEGPEWCEDMAERVLEAKSLEELGL